MYETTREKNSTTRAVVKSYDSQGGITVHCTNAGEAGVFVTAIATDSSLTNAEKIVRDLYQAVVKILIEHDVGIVHERIFATKRCAKNIVDSRAEIFNSAGLNPNTPLSLVQVSPCFGEGVAGLLFHAVPNGFGRRVETLKNAEGKPLGNRWSTEFADYLLLQPGCEPLLDSELQMEEYFDYAAVLLQKQGFDYSDIARTWFYINNILVNYATFNRVRDQKYQDSGLITGSPPKLPASTGINGTDIHGSAMIADILAVKPRNNKIRFLSNPQQKDAFEYGASFSRAALIQEKDVDLIQVSGTASIGEDGKTLYRNDAASQIACTLDNFEALLQTANANLNHVATANIFVKRPEFYDTFIRIARERGIVQFPGVPVVADICREDLLFEIDAELVVPKR